MRSFGVFNNEIHCGVAMRADAHNVAGILADESSGVCWQRIDQNWKKILYRLWDSRNFQLAMSASICNVGSNGSSTSNVNLLQDFGTSKLRTIVPSG